MKNQMINSSLILSSLIVTLVASFVLVASTSIVDVSAFAPTAGPVRFKQNFQQQQQHQSNTSTGSSRSRRGIGVPRLHSAVAAAQRYDLGIGKNPPVKNHNYHHSLLPTLGATSPQSTAAASADTMDEACRFLGSVDHQAVREHPRPPSLVDLVQQQPQQGGSRHKQESIVEEEGRDEEEEVLVPKQLKTATKKTIPKKGLGMNKKNEKKKKKKTYYYAMKYNNRQSEDVLTIVQVVDSTIPTRPTTIVAHHMSEKWDMNTPWVEMLLHSL